MGDELRDAVKAYDNHDYQTAVRIWRSYAAKGDIQAQYFLGVAYHKGHGVKKSLNQTIAWFRKAAQGGHPTAMFNMGYAHWFGIGVRQNLGRAVDWWKKSAKKGEAAAQYNLARCYLSGKGTGRDLREAYYWINLAAAQKYPGADKDVLIIQQEAKRSGLTLTELSKDTTAQDSTAPDSINPASKSGFNAATVGTRGAVVHLSKPSSSAITKLSSGTPIKVISTRAKWSQVKIPVAINVWVFGALIAQNGDTARKGFEPGHDHQPKAVRALLETSKKVSTCVYSTPPETGKGLQHPARCVHGYCQRNSRFTRLLPINGSIGGKVLRPGLIRVKRLKIPLSISHLLQTAARPAHSSEPPWSPSPMPMF